MKIKQPEAYKRCYLISEAVKFLNDNKDRVKNVSLEVQWSCQGYDPVLAEQANKLFSKVSLLISKPELSVAESFEAETALEELRDVLRQVDGGRITELEDKEAIGFLLSLSKKDIKLFDESYTEPYVEFCFDTNLTHEEFVEVKRLADYIEATQKSLDSASKESEGILKRARARGVQL